MFATLQQSKGDRLIRSRNVGLPSKMKRYFSFMIAGSFGFAVDVAVLLGLIHLVHVDAFSARIIAIGCAVCCTWLINRSFTFDKSAHSLAMEGARYWGIAAFSACINFAAYSLLLLIDRQMMPILALAASSACGTLFSYNGYARFVFRR